jgi:hypothetical protein
LVSNFSWLASIFSSQSCIIAFIYSSPALISVLICSWPVFTMVYIFSWLSFISSWLVFISTSRCSVICSIFIVWWYNYPLQSSVQ